MSDCMAFPDDWREFLRDCSFKDTEEIYTNGSELIPVFRVEQLIEHLELNQKIPRENKKVIANCISCGVTFNNIPAYLAKDFLCYDCKARLKEELREQEYEHYLKEHDCSKCPAWSGTDCTRNPYEDGCLDPVVEAYWKEQK